jgi:hypothetical protein
MKARQRIDGTPYGPEGLKAFDQAWSVVAGNIRVARCPATRHRLDGDAAFDAALSAYQCGGNPEGLLRAAGAIIDSKTPIAREHADRISEMTDQLNIEIDSYGDAAYAVRRWFVVMRRAGARR